MTHRRTRTSAHDPAAPVFEFFASCPEGFEAALARELRAIGAWRVRPLKGRVAFAGGAIDGERACLWSRLASRVTVVLARFDALYAEELYEGVYAMPWERILRRGATIAVTARGTTPELRNTHFTALKAKDALCDRLADETGARADVDLDRPDARISVALRGERVTVSLDLSGEPLFRRMPRMATKPGAAAHFLRPDYAALLLEEAGWGEACRELAKTRAEGDGVGAREAAPGMRTVLVDPVLAGGGVTVEAAHMLADEAPGLTRRHWGFEAWLEHDAAAWGEAVAEAERRAQAAEDRPLGSIVACDADPRAAAFGERVIASTGLSPFVTTAPAEAGTLAAAAGAALAKAGASGEAGTRAFIVADAGELSFTGMQAYLGIFNQVRRLPALAGSAVAALDRTGLMARAMACPPASSIAVRPGNEEARILAWPAGAQAVEGAAAGANRSPKAARDTAARRGSGAADEVKPAARVDVGQGKPVPVLMPEAEQFANRLKKNARRLRKWSRRAGVTCYRVYDADLPDYAAAIDLYEGAEATPGRWLVVAEYAAPKTVDPELAQARLLDMLALAPRILDVEPEHVFARARTHSRGGSQYGRREGASAVNSNPLIREGGLTFEVNFNDYLDTGIFLDHRVTRGMVRDLVRERPGCRFLNLFAYTGTATCYAADGGAAETVTVDLSNTYLDWAERNMALNGHSGGAHHFVRDDVMRWISDQRRTGNRWDLIFCDPPTFSNSTKMGQRTWDVQRDHVELLTGVAALLAPGGEAVFSCNLRGFRPDLAALAEAGVDLTDITAQTIPEDFSRNKKIHHCYRVRRA